MKNIYINSGYYNIKSSCNNIYKIMPSKAQVNDCAKKYILIENEKLEVGVGKRNINTKNNNLLNEFLTKYAILDFSNIQDIVNVLLALPINQYLNNELKQEYKDNLNQKILKHNINGIDKTVKIEKCEVYMEGAAAMLNYNIKGVVGLIDIGGNTANCMIFENGKLIKETVIQLDCSMLVLEQEILNSVNSRMSTNYQEYEFDTLLISNDKTVKEIIDNSIYKFIENMSYKLQLKKWNIYNMALFFTGGGSIILKSHLQKVFPLATFSENALFDNLKGLEVVGRVIF